MPARNYSLGSTFQAEARILDSLTAIRKLSRKGGSRTSRRDRHSTPRHFLKREFGTVDSRKTTRSRQVATRSSHRIVSRNSRRIRQRDKLSEESTQANQSRICASDCLCFPIASCALTGQTEAQSATKSGVEACSSTKRRNGENSQLRAGHWDEMVGPCGLEPQTSTVSRWRSSQLSYGPTAQQLQQF
jgi:hypothetical protein